MPYVGPPSSSSSPVATMSFAHAPHHHHFHHAPSPAIAAAAAPRAELKRPARHHQRSHSSDPIASTSNFIFVQPATPDDKGAGRRAHSWMSSSPASAPNGRTDGSTSPGGPTYNTLPRQQRRMRLTALTPAAGAASNRPASPGPSSQDESSDNARAGSPRSSSPGTTTPTAAGQETPRASTSSGVFDNAFPFGHSASASASSSSLPSPTLTDDMMVAKPALMVRKKSGELVRPSLKADTSRRDFSKPRSAPATPICPKYVHFDTQLEHVKHFLAQQRPAAVSRTGSPIETETEDEPESFPFPAMARAQAGTLKLVLPNFPTHSRTDRDAYVESLTLTPDGKAIRGIVRVRNLAFEKWVAVRFTLDTWQTVSEVSGEHHEALPGGQADRFVFTIRLQDLLANIDHKVMYLAIRYTAGGRETWDNNDGQNYRVEFKRVPLAPAAAAAARAGAAAAAAAQRKTAWSVTNAGQAADRMADLRRELDRLVRDDAFDDDETTGDSQSAAAAASSSSTFSSASHNSLGLPAGRTLRLGFGPDSRSYSETHVSGRGEGPAASLSGRYDFGNSLKMFSSGGAAAQAGAGAAAKGAAAATSGGMKERKGPRFPAGSLQDPVRLSLSSSVLNLLLVPVQILTLVPLAVARRRPPSRSSTRSRPRRSALALPLSPTSRPLSSRTCSSSAATPPLSTTRRCRRRSTRTVCPARPSRTLGRPFLPTLARRARAPSRARPTSRRPSPRHRLARTARSSRRPATSTAAGPRRLLLLPEMSAACRTSRSRTRRPTATLRRRTRATARTRASTARRRRRRTA